ncbi:MAG: SprB repeat-containing protein, partial [Bacteroidota bacterium]
HTSPTTAEQNNDQITVYTPTGVARDTIWARIIYAENLCVVVSPLVIVYQNTIAVTMLPAGPALGCQLDGSGLGLFNLRQLDGEIGGGQPITYYTDAAGTNMVPEPTAFESIPITIFARAGLGACAAVLVPVELEIVASPNLGPFVASTSCPGNLDGSIILNAASMAGPLTYRWAGDTLPARDTIEDLAPGNYAVTVTDAIGCETSQTFSIVDGLRPQMICSLERAVSAPGALNGVVRLEMAEGRRPYQVTYSGAAAGGRIVSGAVGLINGLGAGTYDFVVTDADGCVSDTCTVEVAEVIPITLTCSVRNNSDGGVVLGSARTVIEGGVPPFLVQLTDAAMMTTDFPNEPNGEIIFRDLAIGDYSVTVTGADGAVSRCIFSIVQVACPLTITNVRQFPVDCSGSDNIIVSITGAGNNGDISFIWSGPNNVEIFNGMQDAGPLPPGEYFITINDESGCPPIPAGPFVVVNPGQPEYSATTTGISSACSDNGSIEVEYLRGGNPPFVVHLVDANTDMELATTTVQDTGRVVAFFDLTGAATGPNYYVYLTDVIGCFADTTFLSIIGEAAPTLSLDAANQMLTPPGCIGDSTGTIQLVATGGSGNYTYRWLDYPQLATGRVLPDGNSQSDLPAGDYTIEVADVGGCLDTFQLSLADGLQPTLSCTNPTGGTGNMRGSVMVELDNGTADYTLNLNSSALDTTIMGLPAGLRLVSDLPAGNYVGTLTDANNCTTTTCSFTIAGAPCILAAIATIDSVDCTGTGTISVAVVGNMDPTTFTWAEPSFPDAATVMPNTPGRYDVRITDQNGCSLDTFFTVFARDNTPMVTSAAPADNRLCFDGEFMVPLSFTGQPPFDLVYEIEGQNGGGILPGLQQFSTTVDTLRLQIADFPTDSVILRLQSVTDGNCSNDFADQLYTLFFERPDTVRRFDVTCETDPIDIGGRSFTPMNPSDTFMVDDGSLCGLRFEVDLTFQTSNEIPDTVEVFLCPGTDFIVAETQDTFNAARPEGPVAYPRPGACDSIVYLRMDIPVQNFGAFSNNACVGDTIFYGDRFFTAENTSGLARLPGQAADGCDSLVFVTTSFRRTGELRLFGDFNICPGDSIDLRFTYDGPGGIDAIIEDTQG